MKSCTNCGGSGPFGLRKGTKDGLKSQCKKCCAVKQRAYVAAHPEIWVTWAATNADRLRVKDATRYAANPEGEKARVRGWQLRNPEKFRVNYTRGNLRKYGLTPEDRQALFDKQGGKCAICPALLKPGRTGMQIDHSTGKVRGLLCHPCNMMLGDFKERLLLFQAALDYLRRGPVVGLTPAQRPPVFVCTRASNIWYGYGLTQETFQELLDCQNGRCAICVDLLGPGQGTHIDHDHDHRFGKKRESVRGLLCRSCNLGLGHAREDARVLQGAVSYLRATESAQVA